eukprot:CAMPEP_0183733360 /NCGR_PEP_ID=MMETSP0737-20130205/40948_1 /TAXON_ID=385413 /ORGANISM="Thalassiosira miniscula, Strain CCMP1093" /LENGTH=233 /DNA_ID=CAMNT_0025966599 /DNA_START=51 /DNA_END=749 /DNA_ORIENTATION=-
MDSTDLYPFLTYYYTSENDRNLGPAQHSPYNLTSWQQQRANSNDSADFGMAGSGGQVPYARAVFGFVIALFIYFCILSYYWDMHGEASRKEVDRSIIKKRVLRHGQSQLFSRDEKYASDDEAVSKPSACCCIKRKKRLNAPDPQPAGESVEICIDPAPESAEDILKSYRDHKMCVECNSMRLNNGENGTDVDQSTTGSDDELVRAEEGTNTPNDEMVCPICLEPFHIGEQVAW